MLIYFFLYIINEKIKNKDLHMKKLSMKKYSDAQGWPGFWVPVTFADLIPESPT